MIKNYYKILEINQSANEIEIKKAFRKKAIKYHPDKHLGDDYMVEKFIEIKEAYDCLLDKKLKEEYDIEYFKHYRRDRRNKADETPRDKNEPIKKEKVFQYKRRSPYFSAYDRVRTQTNLPDIDHWGNTIENNADFFCLPKNIGIIVSGYTDLKKGDMPMDRNTRILTYIKSLLISSLFSFVIIWFFAVVNPIWIIVWITIPLIIALLLTVDNTTFNHKCNYVGINGFAEFECILDRENIINSREINFSEITDFLNVSVVMKENFIYTGTSFSFVWLKDNNVIMEIASTHKSKENTPDKSLQGYWLSKIAEKYWTIYLLDNMENKLSAKGFLTFNLYIYDDNKYVKVPYIHLGIGFIKFITSEGSINYKFDEINKVYTTKENELYIEHNNYQKKYFFMESGNKNGIPLSNLSNRLFFFKAFELLLGYKII